MKSDDIIMKAAIIHILDSSVGIPVLSDQAMEIGPDFSDFLKAHIEKSPRAMISNSAASPTAPR